MKIKGAFQNLAGQRHIPGIPVGVTRRPVDGKPFWVVGDAILAAGQFVAVTSALALVPVVIQAGLTKSMIAGHFNSTVGLNRNLYVHLFSDSSLTAGDPLDEFGNMLTTVSTPSNPVNIAEVSGGGYAPGSASPAGLGVIVLADWSVVNGSAGTPVKAKMPASGSKTMGPVTASWANVRGFAVMTTSATGFVNNTSNANVYGSGPLTDNAGNAVTPFTIPDGSTLKFDNTLPLVLEGGNTTDSF